MKEPSEREEILLLKECTYVVVLILFLFFYLTRKSYNSIPVTFSCFTTTKYFILVSQNCELILRIFLMLYIYLYILRLH
jgi:hypothetical protein